MAGAKTKLKRSAQPFDPHYPQRATLDLASAEVRSVRQSGARRTTPLSSREVSREVFCFCEVLCHCQLHSARQAAAAAAAACFSL
jgi:hypothetical protein